MGLEDFTSDDDSSTSSSSGSTSSSTTQQTRKDNSPSYAEQAFSDRLEDTPRGIKYWIKGSGKIWRRSFSTRRFDTGEVIMYSVGHRAKEGGLTVMVFTTIQSIIDRPDIDQQEDIWVTIWDLEENEPLEEGTYITKEDKWQSELDEVCREYIDKVQEMLD